MINDKIRNVRLNKRTKWSKEIEDEIMEEDRQVFGEKILQIKENTSCRRNW